MKRHVFFTGVILPLILFPSIVQAGWARTYGTAEYEEGFSVCQTPDGGYVVAGYSQSANSLWILKTDENGDTVWTVASQEEWPGSRAYSVVETSDGNFVVAGYSTPLWDGRYHLTVVKIDADGNPLWTKGDWDWFETPPGSIAYSIQETVDQGFIVTGATSHAFDEIDDLLLVKLDSAGDTVWTRTYGGQAPDCGHCVRQTSDTGYIVCGYCTHESVRYMWLLKTDSEGDTVWTNNLPWMELTGSPGELYSVEETSDGGYVMTGYIAVTLDGKIHLSLYKTDSAGDSLWYRYDWDWFTDPDSTGGSGLSIKETTDGGLVITGHRSEFGVPITDLWLLKTDSEGELLWTRIYGGADEDMGYCVDQTSDVGFIVVGATKSFGAGGFDIWLLRTDEKGDTLAVVEEPVVSGVSSWHVLNSVGQRITLQYSESPYGFHAQVFDASGRKVDEIHAAEASGTLSWGGKQKPGVYFVRPTSFQQTVTKKVVLIQ